MRSAALDDARWGQSKDLEVGNRRLLVYVLDIERYTLVEVELTPPGNLPKARDPGRHGETTDVPWVVVCQR